MFKIGDEVRGIDADIRGYEGIIVGIDNCKSYVDDNDGRGYQIKITKQPRGGGHGTAEWRIGSILKRATYWEDSIQLIGHKNMNTLTSKIKRLFNKKKQLQYKAGFIDECGAKTALGNEEFEVLVDEFHEDSFTERAAEKIKEDKEAENKK